MKIHLAQLAPDVSENELRALLQKFGEVREVRFIGPKDAAEPAAVVEMDGGHAAAEVVRHRLDGTVLHGKPLFVEVLLFS
jgi:hypothetical protein